MKKWSMGLRLGNLRLQVGAGPVPVGPRVETGKSLTGLALLTVGKKDQQWYPDPQTQPI